MSQPDTLAQLAEIASNPRLLEIGRKAIEDELVEWRDSRLSTMRNNGLVIREKNGEESSIIRFGPENALRIGLLAIASYLAEGEKHGTE